MLRGGIHAYHIHQCGDGSLVRNGKVEFLSKASDSGYDDVTAAIDCCGFVCQCGNSELGAVTSEQSGVIMSLSLL